jgi:succinate dehydrogenase / fumarate reductase, cytochrome b subunit
MGWIGSFYRSSIGKKIVVAVTGIIMYLFLIIHMLGNLQVFEGPGHAGGKARLDAYAELLRVEPGILWAFRLVLLAAVVLHTITILQLWSDNRAARGGKYLVTKRRAATVSSRTMIWGGLLIAAFIVFHILHFTTGTILSGNYEHGMVYANVVKSFQNPLVAGLYLVAMVVIFFHIKHGIVSGFQTLGTSHPRYLAFVEKAGPVLAFLITAGFALTPIFVLAGLVKL